MTACWADLRAAAPDVRAAIREEAVHQRFDAVVSDLESDLAGLPPTILGVLAPAAEPVRVARGSGGVARAESPSATSDHVPPPEFGAHSRPLSPDAAVDFAIFRDVSDSSTLEAACDAVRKGDGFVVLTFRDPTNIPLEIVLAAADGSAAKIITAVSSAEEAGVHLAVLEHGPHGVMLAARAPGQVTELAAAVRSRTPDLALVTFTVTGTRHVGRGERACVDTCAYLRPDEGLLVGSRSRALMLCVSETHPLPYMPTRPFRVNAGAIMSYTLAGEGRTRYLSELTAGDPVLAVGADGRTRSVTVGRVKIETRPLLAIDATGPDGEPLTLIVQDDWHVRVLGPGAAVLNSTELRPGDEVLGYRPGRDRHVGYPIDEWCREQ